MLLLVAGWTKSRGCESVVTGGYSLWLSGGSAGQRGDVEGEGDGS